MVIGWRLTCFLRGRYDKKTPSIVGGGLRARGGSRTRDQQFRKLLLYPTELPKHNLFRMTFAKAVR